MDTTLIRISAASGTDSTRAAERAPVVVSGPECAYDPFASKQADECGRVLEYFAKKGVAYTKAEASAIDVTVGGTTVRETSPAALDAALAAAGYDLKPIVPPAQSIAVIMAAILC